MASRQSFVAPTAEAVKKFLIGVVAPVVVGAVSTWLLSTQVIAVFHVSPASVIGAVTAVVTFAVTTLVTFLHAHHVLRGTI